MRLLAISDRIEKSLYDSSVRQRFGDVDMVISCGDLPYYYLEYLVSALDRPLFFVRGNHQSLVEHTVGGPRTEPWGAVDLDGRAIEHEGLLMAGLEGSPRYNKGPYQYTESEMRVRALRLVPSLLLNRARHGRYLDLLVTHAPPLDIHDQPDRAHRGFAVFRWLLTTFQPRWMLHGHIHLYHPHIVTRSTFHKSEIINCYGHRTLDLDFALQGSAPARRSPC